MRFNLNNFIQTSVTKRQESLFLPEIQANSPVLSRRIEARSVLVIGGAGSIGAAFIKALLPYKPASLVVVDNNENGLTELVRDLRSSPGIPIPPIFLTYPVDFGDPVFEKILQRHDPFDIVANFAAHKHVRSEKDPFAIEAMITNNVFKARRLLDLLLKHKPGRFFCVSTDKAADPVNVMGASKKLMEQLIMAYSGALHINTARFANVAFSNGSLPAGFLERIAKQQPLSAPIDVARYFVSPEEAGQLCLLACMLGHSGEIFFPKLDPETDAQTFSNIALALLQQLGYEADICQSEQEAREKAALLHPQSKTWPIYFFQSDTSGEKAFETFFSENERVDFERYPTIGVIDGRYTAPSLVSMAEMIAELKAVFQKDALAKTDIIKILEHCVPGFKHLETGKNLDAKM
jgi:FlaA1/EpsC-like NDP-sugar epimerase